MLTKSKKYIMYRGILSLIFAFALSVSAISSPLVRAEEPLRYIWKNLNIPNVGYVDYSLISPDGSKLFVLQKDDMKLLVSVDDGATWSSFNIPANIDIIQTNTDGSKILAHTWSSSIFYMSTDGGNTWVRHNTPSAVGTMIKMSPDGSTVTSCIAASRALYVSMDNGVTWFWKGNECPTDVFDSGKMASTANYLKLLRSTDYGATWTTTSLDRSYIPMSFSKNGEKVFDLESRRISLDGGRNWQSLLGLPEAVHDATFDCLQTGISNDGKKLFIVPFPGLGVASSYPIYTSVDGGRTWQKWGDDIFEDYNGDGASMSADGSKIFTSTRGVNPVYRLGTLSTSTPATPGGTGTGTGGTTTPSTPATPSTGPSSSGASTTAASSSTSNKKPGKSSSILAETGNSIWLVSGLAVIAVVAGGLALRKRP